ncbi:MAG TPA: sigma-70 family RNA polymerase sigma factor, partial [Gemmataceae bacterium]|nr:sigma-70 family RNA polymerase sigma factor [Gemmataceae bacterium]
MAHALTSPVGYFIHRLSVAHLVAAAPDSELVERFTVHREEAAFAALVRRHGPLVFGVCRRVLNDPQAAEDCFQETFLVLARKAGSLRGPEALGPWLYGVAMRTALKARARAARRRECERRASVTEMVAPSDGLVWQDLKPFLDEAIAGLPEKYRTPFVLHHLEGLTVAEVACRLGCPQGTTCARLARAKEQLRTRLARHGLAWCTGALATALAQGAAVPTSLAARTVQAAISIAAGEAAGALSASVAALTMGGIKVMSVFKVKVALAVFLTVSALGVGVGVTHYARPGGGHAGAGRATMPAAGQANGNQRPSADSVVFERFYAGGFYSQRGFELSGVSPKARNAKSGCEEPEALDRKSKDTRVEVQERRMGNLMFGLGVNSDAGLVGSIVLNERNFNLRRPPICFDDLFSGNAFRGAGQEFRIEATPGTVEGFKPGGDFTFLNSIEYQVPVRANNDIIL